MQNHAQRQTEHNAHAAQNDILPEHVGPGFPTVEAQHFDGGDLPHPLGDIDVAQVEQHDKGQCRRAGQHQSYHIVKADHHLVDKVPGVRDHSDVGHAVRVGELSGQGVFILPILHLHQQSLGLIGAEYIRVGTAAQINVVLDIVFR